METSNSLVIFGATSPLATALADIAVSNGLSVIAVVRATSDASAIESAATKVLRADVMNPDELATLADSLPEDALFVSALGGRPGETSGVDSIGNCNAIDLAVSRKASRFVLITTVGAGDSRSALPETLLPILGPLADEKSKAESHLKRCGVNYTILRPGHLLATEPTGNAILVEDPRTLGAVTRSDLAAQVFKVLRSPGCTNRTFAVTDKNLLKSSHPVIPFDVTEALP
jgi:nucleoside-diphosphate-sugar epimerase